MHWLPLVAMVIASALPFPQNSVARIVAAMTEPGRSLDRENSPGTHRSPAQVLEDYNPHGNSSKKDYNMTNAPSNNSVPLELSEAPTKDYTHSSLSEELSMFERKPLDKRNSLDYNRERDSNSNSILSAKDSNTDRRKLRAPAGNNQRDSVSQDNHLSEDYKAGPGRGDDSNYADFDNDAVGSSQNSLLAIPRPTAPRAPSTHNPRVQHRDPETGEDRGARQGEGGAGSPEAGRGLEQPDHGLGMEAGLEVGMAVMDSLQEADELLFLDAHPRVLFSPSPSPPDHPPLLLMLEAAMLAEEEAQDEGEGPDTEGHGDREVDRDGPPSWPPRPALRSKRSPTSTHDKRGERSVCESESVWVTDKTSAIDSHGRTVTILPEIQTLTGPLKQYFYETRCRRAERQRGQEPSGGSRAASGAPAAGAGGTGVAGAGCLGVDKKQWVSECKAKQSYVRALTKDTNNRTGWRWIRIDSSCVCVLLSRAARH
ncbi:uncharacterized protein ntf4 [Aplochiton taeniatus]